MKVGGNGGNGGKLSVLLFLVAVGGKIRAQLQVQLGIEKGLLFLHMARMSQIAAEVR